MNIQIKPSVLSGTVTIPASKSISHRVLLLALLSEGATRIKNLLDSEDISYTLNACHTLGAGIKRQDNSIIVQGTGGLLSSTGRPIQVGNSGTTARLLTAVSALSNRKVILQGTPRLHQRPFDDLSKALLQQGIKVTESKDSIIVHGARPQGGTISVSGKTSSQFISALILIAPFALQNTVIVIKDSLRSQPYVELTCAMMQEFGVRTTISRKDNAITQIIIPAGQSYQAVKEYIVEGDYSAASYFLVANALGSNVIIHGLSEQSLQGDSAFPVILENLPDTINMSNIPDTVPSLAVFAAFQSGKATTFTNIGHLRGKETDRIQAIVNELSKMSIRTSATLDSLTIFGGEMKGASIETYDDHRIAMSFAVAGLSARGETVIKDAQVVSKSYPNFWEDLKKLGAEVTILHS